MKSWQRMVMALGLMAVAVLWTDSAQAAGRTQTRAGNAKGDVTRTSTCTQAQLRQQLRDGSCLTGTSASAARTVTGTGAGDRLRLRDGSCLTK